MPPRNSRGGTRSKRMPANGKAGERNQVGGTAYAKAPPGTGFKEHCGHRLVNGRRSGEGRKQDPSHGGSGGGGNLAHDLDLILNTRSDN